MSTVALKLILKFYILFYIRHTKQFKSQYFHHHKMSCFLDAFCATPSRIFSWTPCGCLAPSLIFFQLVIQSYSKIKIFSINPPPSEAGCGLALCSATISFLCIFRTKLMSEMMKQTGLFLRQWKFLELWSLTFFTWALIPQNWFFPPVIFLAEKRKVLKVVVGILMSWPRFTGLVFQENGRDYQKLQPEILIASLDFCTGKAIQRLHPWIYPKIWSFFVQMQILNGRLPSQYPILIIFPLLLNHLLSSHTQQNQTDIH